jgi:hypothetical protein
MYGRQWAAWLFMISRSDSVKVWAKFGRGAMRRKAKVGMRRTLRGLTSRNLTGPAVLSEPMRYRARLLIVAGICLFGSAAAANSVDAATPSAKLGLIATGGPQAVQPGSSVSYTFTVLDHGADARRVMLTDPLPATVTPVSVRSTDGSCVLGQTVRCSLGTIAANGTANVAIIARAVAAGDGANTGSLSATNQPTGQPPAHASAIVTITAATPPASPAAAPTISSGGLGQIDQYTAVVQTVLGSAPVPTTYWVQYGRTTRYGQSTPDRQLQGDGGSMLELLRGLKAGVVYHFRPVAQNSAGQTFGRDESFETLGRRRPALDANLAIHRSSSRRSAVASATLEVPRGVTVHDACHGKVTFTLQASGRILARRRVSLNGACQANATFSLASSAKGLRVQATFAGNSSVTSRTIIANAH